jgi:hypothetical protein
MPNDLTLPSVKNEFAIHENEALESAETLAGLNEHSTSFTPADNVAPVTSKNNTAPATSKDNAAPAASTDSSTSSGKPTTSFPSTAGAFTILTLNKDRDYIKEVRDERTCNSKEPSKKEAVDIYFGLNINGEIQVPKEQLDLELAISKVLRVIQCLYSGTDNFRESKFRIYYVRLFRIAQLGLEGKSVFTSIANSSLHEVISDIVADEAGNVKNKHMKDLGIKAITYSIPFLIFYVLLSLVQPLQPKLAGLKVEFEVMANFMLIWIGCFAGVWLSYGIRTSTFSLDDLIVTDADRLYPATRLIFAGIFTMVIGIFLLYKIIDIQLGSYHLYSIANQPMLAFLVGIFCGISELALPNTVSQKVSAAMAATK